MTRQDAPEDERLVLEAGTLHDIVISAVLRKLAEHPPFRTYSLAVMVHALLDQLRHGASLLGMRGGRLVCYAGWLRVPRPQAEAWLAGDGAMPTPDWTGGQAAIVTVVVADDPRDLPALLRGISAACEGMPVYRMRIFGDGRPDHRRRPITGRARPMRGDPAPVPALPVAGPEGLVHALWAVARGALPRSALAAAGLGLRMIDDPATFRAICAEPDLFIKNYAFLETMGQGRFSDNGPAWAARAALTQPAYARNQFLREPARLAPLYARAFGEIDRPDPEALAAAMIGVGITAASAALGMEQPIPWPQAWAESARRALGERQWIGFAGAPREHLDRVEATIARLRLEIAALWQPRPDVAALLDRFAEAAEPLPGFDPIDELIQNLIASSETSAAALLWALAELSRDPAMQDALRSGALPEALFLREILRLHPPVPFVTRRAVRPCTVAGQTFAAGEGVLLSVLGVHYDPAFWADPARLDPHRPEYDHPASRAHYLPFLSGPRACGGRRLAEMELAAALRALVMLFDFRMEEQSSVGIAYGLSFRPVITGLTMTRRC